MQYLIWKVLLMVKTYLVVLLHSKKLIWKVLILIHTEPRPYLLSRNFIRKVILKSDFPSKKSIQSHDYIFGEIALYEVKWVLFKWVFCYVKVLPHSCLPDIFLPLIRPFKWCTAWSFISKDIRNTSSRIFGYLGLPNKVGLFGTFNFELL